LMPLVYGELRRLAKQHMRHERAGHTLQTTALIHEAYLRLIDASQAPLENRRHFFAVASRLMRQALVDLARERGSLKRGGGTERVSLLCRNGRWAVVSDQHSGGGGAECAANGGGQLGGGGEEMTLDKQRCKLAAGWIMLANSPNKELMSFVRSNLKSLCR
jgi:hypothetical protein